jgi:hypothetical protein
MGILIHDIMKTIFFLLMIITLASCKVGTQTNVETKESSPPDFVVNSNLSLNDYSDVHNLPKEGVIPTAEIAFKVAEPILIGIYGKDAIESEKPFSINLENSTWIIEGTFNGSEEAVGGVAYIEIRKDTGEVLKVIHTK